MIVGQENLFRSFKKLARGPQHGFVRKLVRDALPNCKMSARHLANMSIAAAEYIGLLLVSASLRIGRAELPHPVHYMKDLLKMQRPNSQSEC